MTTSKNISVNLTSELRLEQALNIAGIKDVASVTGLSIAGTFINDDDFSFIIMYILVFDYGASQQPLLYK